MKGLEYVTDSTFNVDSLLVSFLELTNTNYMETGIGKRGNPIMDIKAWAKFIALNSEDEISIKEEEKIPKLREKPIINIKEWAINKVKTNHLI